MPPPKITAERVAIAARSASNRTAILKALDVAASAKNYERLARVAAEAGIDLPERIPTGKPGPRPELRTCPVWDREELVAAVKGAINLQEVLDRLGLARHALTRLRAAAAELGVELPPAGARIRFHRKRRQAAMARLFVKGDRRVAGHRLKKLILDANLLPYVCDECGQGPAWNGRPLVLQIDHINGDPADNRLENLRFLCPNCHTQTETFAGRNVARHDAGSSNLAGRPVLARVSAGSNPAPAAIPDAA